MSDRRWIGNHKISILLLTLVFIEIPVMLVACDSIGTDMKDKAKDLLEDVKTEVKQSELPLSPQIATAEGMSVSCIVWNNWWLAVRLKPSSIAIANKKYVVDLYEKGVLRDTTSVQWNQPELNVSKHKTVKFSISEQEYNAYEFEDVSHIFTVKVHE